MSAFALACALLLLGPQERSTAAEGGEALELCADCHPGHAQSYARTGMAHALEPLRSGELAGLEPVADEPGGFRYAFEEAGQGDGARARLVESALLPGSSWREAAPLVFAVGAGRLDRSFVVERGRRLWMAPLEVLTQGGGPRAVLAPAHAMSPGLRFGQPITPECLSCHTDAPPPRTWPLNVRVAGWEPRGISCAGCHAGLAEHVAFRSRELGGDPDEQQAGVAGAARDPILDPGALSRVERMQICAGCHLQGDARIELQPDRIGPPPPGTPLLETRAVFVAREPGEEIGFVSQVERLVLSRCYLESSSFPDGGLSCESCHDPHRSVFEPEEALRVRAACLDCHPQGSGSARARACALEPARRTPGRDCVDCHLRRQGVFDVGEVQIHDHWIRARPPPAPERAAALRFPESPEGDWSVFTWPDAPAPAHVDDPGLWAMALDHGGHGERALARLVSGPSAFEGTLPMLQHVRGSLLERASRLKEARAAYTIALSLDPELAESATNLGPLLARLGDPQIARRRLDHLIERYPLAEGALRNRALVRLQLGDEPGCVADLEHALALLPDPQLARALAELARRRGDAEGERRWEQEQRRLSGGLPEPETGGR